MKKTLSLIIAILLILVGCSAAPDATEAGSNALVNMEFSGIYEVQDSLAGYTDYLATYQKFIPESFVHLDNLPNLGTFGAFVPTTGFPNQYIYYFDDYNGKELAVEITHLSSSSGSISTSEFSLATVTDDMTSMRKKPESASKSVIARNDVEYRYAANGKLTSIVWCNDGIQYKLYGQMYYYENYILKGLLSISETDANAALAKIKQALNAD